ASAFANCTVVREQSAIAIDARVPFDRAALIGCGIMTGVGAVLNRARVETGASIAVFGLGGIGLSCVQGGVLAGAARIIAVDVVPPALSQNKAILGCRYGTARPRRDFPMLADLYLGGRLKIDELITRRYALDQFAAALDDLRGGRLARGVFTLGGSAHG